VPAIGVRARCSVCGGIITVGAGGSIDEEFGADQLASVPETVAPVTTPAAPVREAFSPAASPVVVEASSPEAPEPAPIAPHYRVWNLESQSPLRSNAFIQKNSAWIS
jgi:hypothetical protein